MPGQAAGRTCRLKYFQLPRYWEEIIEDISSTGQLLARLQEIEASFVARENEHITVYLEDSNENVLHVGLGGDLWTLTHITRGEDYEYLYSMGDDTSEGREPFLFPEWTEISRKRMIPSSKAREVVREWIERGTLSETIRWTDDCS